MADPAKTDEIEDVLSSIRRLVSEHQPPARSEPVEAQEPTSEQTSATPQAAATAEHPPKSDRLLLTPALRVTDPEDPWVPITPRAEENPDSQAETPDADQEISRDDGADWARELWATDSDETASSPDARQVHEPDPQLQADQWEAGDLPPVDHEGTEVEDALPDPVDVTEAVLQDMAEAAAVDEEEEAYSDVPLSFIRSTSSVSEYEPEEDNVAMPDGDLPTPTLELAEARAASAPPEEHTPRVKVEIVRAPAEEGELSVTAQEVASELPEEIAQQLATDLTDEQGSDVEAGPEVESEIAEDHADAIVTDFLATDQEQTASSAAGSDEFEDLGEAPFSFPDESDGFVDEEALREIIADVVREELQGEMGVRITRNVRKLVRREIRLALAAKDVE